MQNFIDKLMKRLEEESYDMEICEEQFDMNSPYFMDVPYKMVKLDDAKEIIKELAEQHKVECVKVISEVDKEKLDSLHKKILKNNKMLEIVTEEEINALIQAEEHNNGWIPCEERYPDTDDYILLSFSNFSTPLVGRYEEDEEGGAFYIGDDTETCVSQDIFVNAWMPLVKPYRGR